MAEFKISRIKFTWLGDWAPSFNYVKDDIVRYGAKSYVCLHGHTSSPNFYTDLEKQDLTTVPITADPQWQLMFDGYEWQGDWTPSNFYNLGDIVKYRGIVYICVNRHTSSASTVGLEGDIIKWALYAKSEEWTGDWSPNTKYSVNDIVKWGGIVYRCIFAHTSASLVSGLEQNQGSWEVVVPSEQWQGNWTVSTKYKVNDIVKYGGIVYRCTMAHTSSTTVSNGLEIDLDLLDSTLSKWEIVQEGIEYLGNWVPEITGVTPSPGYRYKLNDVVKWGAGIWICSEGHTSTDTFDLTKWIIYVPGFEYDNTWDNTTIYQKGDVVKYGGYSYYAIRNNTNSIPSTALGDSTLDNWELLTKGFKIQGEWAPATSYRVGDVLRRSGQLYVAVQDTGTDPNDDSTNWELVIPGEQWQTRWQSGANYVIGDMLTFQSNTYRCLVKHTSNLATRPDINTSGLWTLVNEGDEFNSLREQGDLKFYGVTEDGSSVGNTNLPIGIDGQALQVVSTNEPDWTSFQLVEKVYYVSLDGVDQPNYGTTINAPWRTVKYACDSVIGPATIFIKVGVYSEQLPIKVPRDVALVGEELRSTIIEPAQGYALSNMFYVNNGTGIRNMTLRGLNGTLGPFNQYLTQRPTAGAYVSLDPGLGPDDTSVWIINKSCYVQNVTTFGNGCTGLKIDGAIHNGGNRSIVANDFTQVLSDGIGVWCTNKGLTELVSVFSYYGHIGYLAENGGKIRATNGNSSYGTYGCVAEGVAEDEVAISGVINNQTQEAQIRAAFSGEANDEILKIEFSNAGQNYTSANFAFTGSGVNAQVIGDEIRDNAIFEARILDPVDSTGSIGGGGYISTGNNAQAGDPWSVTIATGDTNNITTYYGCRIILQSGTGTGQYGKVVAYDTVSKIISVASEHFQTLTSTATSVTNNLISANTSSLYVGMPVYFSYETINVVITATSVGTNRVTLTSNAGLVVGMPIQFEGPIGVISGTTVYYVQSIIPGGTQITISTTNGGGVLSLTNATATINGTAGGMLGGLAVGQLYYVIAANFSSTQFAVSTTPGGTAVPLTTQIGLMYIDRAGWSHVNAGTTNIALLDTTSVYRIEPRPTFSLPPYSEVGLTVAGTGLTWSDAVYGADKWALLSQSGTVLTYNGSTFSTVTLPTPAGGVYSAISYGGGKFVAIATNVDSIGNPATTAYSTTGASWTGGTMPGTTSNWVDITYGGGKFVAVSATSGTTAAYSLDGISWSSASLPSSGIWASVAYGAGKFVAIRTTSSVAAYSADGITWTSSTLPASATWTSVTFGNGRFVAVASGGTRSAISFNGIDWIETILPASSNWSKVAYGQGQFLAISSSTTATVAFSDDGYYWEAKTITGNVGRNAVAFGNPNNIGSWITLPINGNSANRITYGSQARGRVEVNGGRISLVKLWDTGSGFTGTTPTLTLTDPNITSSANFECRIATGVLGNPTFINRGIGYKTSTTIVTVSGDGFANILPVGQNLILDNVTRIPRTGANLTLDLISWETSNMPASNLWSSVAYGDKFVAVAGVTGTPTTSAAYSTNGSSWFSSTLPASAAWCGVAYGAGKFVAISSASTEAAYSTNGITWFSATLPAARNWKTVIFGSGVFVAIASGTNKAAYSSDGQTWLESSMPATADWAGIGFGNGLFMAVASGGTVAASSSNGIIWNGKALPSSAAWSLVSFYAGQFIAVASGSDKLAYTTDDGTSWNEITLPTSATWSALTHANGKYLLASGVGDFITSTDGLTWKTRSIALSSVKSFAAGANVFVAVGTGPLSAVAPDGSTDIVYRVLTVALVSGAPPTARISIRVSPAFTRTNAPINGVDVIIREKYSQVRLTGHDFLEIGTGNFVDTNYPLTSVNNFQPDKEVYYRGGGRVFYTSTDQDGNFRVGELFAVEQATGVITISADYFDLSGLSEIRLGGIRVGGTGVVIREFSTDATFTADSNNIVPTQKAIKAYIGRRISGGGSDAATGRLIAGTVSIGPDNIGNTTGIRNQITVPMLFKKGQGGYMTAWSMFADSFNSQLDWQEVGRDLG